MYNSLFFIILNYLLRDIQYIKFHIIVHEVFVHNTYLPSQYILENKCSKAIFKCCFDVGFQCITMSTLDFMGMQFRYVTIIIKKYIYSLM